MALLSMGSIGSWRRCSFPVGAAIGISYALLDQFPITITHDAIRVPNSWRGLRDDVPWSSVASVDVDEKRGVVRLRGPRRRAIGIPLRRYERSDELLMEITSRELAGGG